MNLMKRYWRKYTMVAALSCSLFFLIVTVLFLSVMHLEGPTLNKNDVITADITVLTAGVVNSVRAGKVGVAHLHSTHRQVNTTVDDLLVKSKSSQAWLVVDGSGVDIAPIATNHDKTGGIHLTSSMILLGNVVDVVWTHENEVDLKLLVAYPVAGWATIAHANLATGVVDHSIRLLNTTIAVLGVETETANYCSNSSAHLVNMDFKGGDLRGNPGAPVANPVTVSSAIECCTRCTATPSCQHWTMVGGGECWLKGQSGTLVPGDPAKQLVSGSIAPQSSAQHNTVPSQDFETAATKVTTSVRCCSASKSDPPVATLGAPSPDSLAEVLSALSVPRFDKHCDSVLVPGRCAIRGRAPLPRAMATVVSALLPPPITLADRSQALHRGRLSTALTDTKVLRQALLARSVRFQTRLDRSADATESVTIPPVLQTNRVRADWTDQQPIGTGWFGALVGGNIRSEIIPVSVAGLFFKRTESGAPKQYNDTNFRAARADLRAGRYEAADKKMSSYIKQNLGMFQYVGDLAIVYSPTPVVWSEKIPATLADGKAPHADAKGANTASAKVPAAAHLRRHVARPRPAGRLGLLRSLNERLTYHTPRHHVRDQAPPVGLQPKPEETLHQRPPFGDILLTDGVLDMKRGVAYTQIVERHAGPDSSLLNAQGSGGMENVSLRYHHREWFASAVDAVIVGIMTCGSHAGTDAEGGEGEPEPCLNMALELSREHDSNLIPRAHLDAKPLELTSAQQRKWLPSSLFGASRLTVEAVQFELQLTSSPAATLPDTALSGVVLCVGPSDQMQLRLHVKEDGVPVVVCNNAQRAYVVVTVESNGQTYTKMETDLNIAELAKNANQRIQSALSRGLVVLRSAHIRDFAEKMSRVDLRFDSELDETMTPTQETCADSPLEHRLESFQDGCVVAGTTDTDSLVVTQKNGLTDAALLAQLFQYGRYLLLSSARSAVGNLQGLWADGPTSAWNGDYHLNINLQMSYWAADSVRLPETMAPLRKFIRKLSNTGREVARQMYGCNIVEAWTAHGFVDADLDGFPYGDNQWALCVTCGAWAALSIWEHLITQPFDAAVLMEVVRTLRGVALFFQSYMWAERRRPGDRSGSKGRTMHTGPTTSPENSYVVLFEGSNPGNPTTARALSEQPPPPAPGPPGPEAEPDAPLRLPKLVPFRPPATAEHHSVRQLTFSPTLDVSVLTQASKAYSLAVEWAAELSERCPRSQAHCRQEDPALAGVTDTEWSAFVKELSDDQRIAAAFQKTVAAMVPITVDTTLHDTAHSVAEHLRTAKAQNPAAAAAAAPGHAGMQAGMGTEKEDYCRPERGGCVREYYPFVSDQPAPEESPPFGTLSETLDIGHRHFSALHWVYPNSFLPLQSTANWSQTADAEYVERLYRSAFNTLAAKRAHGGGHTGWSATWEAALWARLRSPDDAYGAIAKFMDMFIAPNLLALHPPLDPLPEPVECSTCFGESAGMKQQHRQTKDYHISEQRQGQRGQVAEPLMSARQLSLVEDVLLPHRGMVTADQSKFQIDANLGYLAAVTEILLQSHVPGFLYLLPALPQALGVGGTVRGLQARWGVLVSLSWRGGRVRAARLVFGPRHPFTTADGTGLGAGVTSPNPLQIASVDPSAKGLPACAAQPIEAGSEPTEDRLHTFRLNGPEHKLLLVAGPPLTNCVLSLCDVDTSESECRAALRRIM